MKSANHRFDITTRAELDVHDLTPSLRAWVSQSGVRDGVAVVASRHTTCAITINEFEPRLIEDLKQFLARLVPKTDDYRHNDIEARGMPDEPRNAHSHLAAMLLGATQSVPIVDGQIDLGAWQSILLVELDGPRVRTVAVQAAGTG